MRFFVFGRLILSDKELMSRDLQPILLGDSKEARALARGIYRRYGIMSYICDTRRRLSHLFASSFAFWRISGEDYPELLCEQLAHLASFDEECIYIAIPTDRRYREFTKKYSDKLSAFFVTGTPEDPFCNIPIMKSERR